MGNWVLVLIFMSGSSSGGGQGTPATMTQIFGFTSQKECVLAGQDWNNPPTVPGERGQHTYRFRCLEVK